MKRTFLSIALAVFILGSCSLTAKSALARAHSQWQAANIAHYRYSLRVACFCGFMDRMPLTIEVRDRQVLSMSYKDGSPVPDTDRPFFASYQTIEGLFDFTDATLAKADETHIEYDPTYGFPANVQIDFIKNAVHDELSLSVLSFERLP